MILHEEIETEKGAGNFTFDERRQKLYAFLPETDRASVHNEA